VLEIREPKTPTKRSLQYLEMGCGTEIWSWIFGTDWLTGNQSQNFTKNDEYDWFYPSHPVGERE
jgi:hypothetical protein